MVAVPVLPLTYYLRTTYITRSRERDPGQWTNGCLWDDFALPDTATGGLV